jgi:hypothetical protein
VWERQRGSTLVSRKEINRSRSSSGTTAPALASRSTGSS